MNNLLSQYQSYLMGTSNASRVNKVTNLVCKGSELNSKGESSEPSKSQGSELPVSSEPQKRLSSSTIKNYLSDTRHFLSWLQKAIQEPEIKPEHITPAVVKVYGSELQALANPDVIGTSSEPSAIVSSSEPKTIVSSSEPSKSQGSELPVSSEPKTVVSSSHPSLATTNRRLSSLRHFGQFLEASGLLDTDPTADLLNPNPAVKFTSIGRILTQYQNFLKDEELSNSTIKNYLSDLKSYLTWTDQNSQLLDNQSKERLS